MARIYALWIVAAVQYVLALWYLSNVYPVGNTVSVVLSPCSGDFDLTITSTGT